MRHLVNAYEVEAGTVKFASNTVWSVPERFWGGVPRRGAISSVLTFTFTFTYLLCVDILLINTRMVGWMDLLVTMCVTRPSVMLVRASVASWCWICRHIILPAYNSVSPGTRRLLSTSRRLEPSYQQIQSALAFRFCVLSTLDSRVNVVHLCESRPVATFRNEEAVASSFLVV